MRGKLNLGLAAVLVIVATLAGGSLLSTALTSKPTTGPSASASASSSIPTSSATPSASGPAPNVQIAGAGFRGPAWPATSVHRPLDDPSNAKVWFAAGTWWAILVVASGETHIARLDPATQTWADTGTLVDNRRSARADAVFDGRHLVVVSSIDRADPSDAIVVTRYSYDAPIRRFVLDADFPVTVSHDAGAAWIDRDSGGRLWVVWLTNGALRAAHSNGDDHRWSAALALGAKGSVTSVALASTSAVLRLVYTIGGDRSLHVAAPRPDGSWSDAAISIVGADSDPVESAGAILTTAAGPVVAIAARLASGGSAGGLAPGLVVAVQAADGSWRQGLVYRTKDNIGSFALLSFPGTGGISVVAASPDGGGQLVQKSADIASLGFDAGPGTPLFSSLVDRNVDTPVTERRAGGSQQLVLATDDVTGHYLHAIVAPVSASLPASRLDPAVPKSPPLPAAAIAIVDDGFVPWPIGSTPPGWSVDDRSTVRGRLLIGRAGQEAFLRLFRSSSGGQLRACSSAPETDVGVVGVVLVVRAAAGGTSDATVASVRGPGGEIASIRFTKHGTIAYYAGSTKVTTTSVIRFGAWYRIAVTVALQPKRFAFSVAPLGGGAQLRLAGVPWRMNTVTGIDKVCVETPVGGPLDGIDVSSLLVTRS